MDSTMNYEIDGPGEGSKAPDGVTDSLLETNIGTVPSPSNPPGKNRVPAFGKPETSGIINTVFYDPTSGSPGTLESTIDSVLEISFDR